MKLFLLLSYLFLVPFVFSSSLNANDEKTNGMIIIILIDLKDVDNGYSGASSKDHRRSATSSSSTAWSVYKDDKRQHYFNCLTIIRKILLDYQILIIFIVNNKQTMSTSKSHIVIGSRNLIYRSSMQVRRGRIEKKRHTWYTHKYSLLPTVVCREFAP